MHLWALAVGVTQRNMQDLELENPTNSLFACPESERQTAVARPFAHSIARESATDSPQIRRTFC